jgi:hypothetical protein
MAIDTIATEWNRVTQENMNVICRVLMLKCLHYFKGFDNAERIQHNVVF